MARGGADLMQSLADSVLAAAQGPTAAENRLGMGVPSFLVFEEGFRIQLFLNMTMFFASKMRCLITVD